MWEPTIWMRLLTENFRFIFHFTFKIDWHCVLQIFSSFVVQQTIKNTTTVKNEFLRYFLKWQRHDAIILFVVAKLWLPAKLKLIRRFNYHRPERLDQISSKLALCKIRFNVVYHWFTDRTTDTQWPIHIANIAQIMCLQHMCSHITAAIEPSRAYLTSVRLQIQVHRFDMFTQRCLVDCKCREC